MIAIVDPTLLSTSPSFARRQDKEKAVLSVEKKAERQHKQQERVTSKEIGKQQLDSAKIWQGFRAKKNNPPQPSIPLRGSPPYAASPFF